MRTVFSSLRFARTDSPATGTTLRSRSLEYQTNLLQDFSKKALDKVFARCKGDEGLDLVIHKVSHLPSKIPHRC